MAVAALHQGFFVSGGTVPLDALSYVERVADKQLFEALLGGKFCYVLNSRQMGKSSLCVRTKAKLEASGCRTAFVDLTKIGGKNVTPEQWYAGLALEIGRSLDMREAMLAYWKDNAHLSPMQRMFGSLREVVLETTDQRVVVFIDEIDSTRSLQFDTDEFFAGIRECFNRRVHDPVYNRLSFCLLGVAVPSDLIRDARTTPFNIGERVYLRDFTAEEAAPFAKGLPDRGDLTSRVYHWTNGHPFLTQSLCVAIARDPSIKTAGDVDRLIEREFLDPKARETNVNLADVGNRVLNMYADGDDVDQYRADILSSYAKARDGKASLVDDESNRITAVLKLSGLMRSEGRSLKVRNRIYDRVFGKSWIKENMPGQELRRQRKAFMLGVVRTALASGLVVGIIAYLAFNNYRFARAAEATALEMSKRAYVADMNRLPVLHEQNNVPAMKRLLASHQNDNWRGIEWDYWNGIIHDALWETPDIGLNGNPEFSPNESEIVKPLGNRAYIFDASTGKVKRTLQLPTDEPGGMVWLPNNQILRSKNSNGGYVFDAISGAVGRKLPEDINFDGQLSRTVSPDGKYAIGSRGTRHGVIDLQTFQFVRESPGFGNGYIEILKDGVHAVILDSRTVPERYEVIDIRTGKPKGRLVVPKRGFAAEFDAHGEILTLGTEDGYVCRYRFSDGKLLWLVKVADAAITEINSSADGKLVGAATRRRASYLIRADASSARVLRRYSDSQSIYVRRDGSLVYASYMLTRAYRSEDPPPVRTFDLRRRNFLLRYMRASDLFAVGEETRAELLRLDASGLRTERKLKLESPVVGWDMDKVRPWAWLTDKKTSWFEDMTSRKRLFSLPRAPGNTDFVSLSDSRFLFRENAFDFQEADLDTRTARPVFRWPEGSRGMDVNEDGSRVCIRSDTGRVGVVDTSTWKTLWSKKEHQQGVLAASFSLDGTLLVTASHDDSAIVWDANTGRKICKLIGHAQSVTGADFVPDGSRVITTSDDRTIRIWETRTGVELTTMGQAGEFPLIGLVTKDGKNFLTRNLAGELKVWPLAYKPNGAKT